MRQAGRYLPEYRKTREKAGNFLDLCYSPDLAAEVALQPVRRFDFDAAILFSDILVVPDALGRNVCFEDGRGPRMTPIDAAGIVRLDGSRVPDRLAPVIETVSLLRRKLPASTALLGFCGAPWTVATYMLAGEPAPDQASARAFSYREPEAFEALLTLLADVSADYLIAQARAGADAVQIFDSWSGVLGEVEFERFCIAPLRRMTDRIRTGDVDCPVIAFPRGAGLMLEGYRQKTGVDCIGLDWTVPLPFARRLQEEGAVQGNLDPMRLLAGGRALDAGIDAILAMLGDGPLIFNLGHGVHPDTNPDHVRQLVNRVRKGRQ